MGALHIRHYGLLSLDSFVGFLGFQGHFSLDNLVLTLVYKIYMSEPLNYTICTSLKINSIPLCVIYMLNFIIRAAIMTLGLRPGHYGCPQANTKDIQLLQAIMNI